MSLVAGLREWLHHHPIGADALLALLILVTALLPLAIGADTERSLP